MFWCYPPCVDIELGTVTHSLLLACPDPPSPAARSSTHWLSSTWSTLPSYSTFPSRTPSRRTTSIITPSVSASSSSSSLGGGSSMPGGGSEVPTPCDWWINPQEREKKSRLHMLPQEWVDFSSNRGNQQAIMVVRLQGVEDFVLQAVIYSPCPCSVAYCQYCQSVGPFARGCRYCQHHTIP